MEPEIVFEHNKKFVWGLSYRMTGSSADADDIVQETFVRYLLHRPNDDGRPARAWLATVAVNLSRDVLRRRRRQQYVGLWLPAPFETENNDIDLVESTQLEGLPESAESPLARFELAESVSFAFLLALEALSPTQRAVLLLRDVFDFNVAETASILDISEQNVKTTHHRARKAVREHREKAFTRTHSSRRRIEDTVRKLTASLFARDAESAARILAADVVSMSDGGGEYFAAKVPIVGREKVLTFLSRLFGSADAERSRLRPAFLNGTFGYVYERRDPPPGNAPKVAILFEDDEQGRINRIYFVLASGKLQSITTKVALQS